MAGDWIKIYRGLMDSAVWSDEWLVKLWLWCLLKANFRDSVWQGRDVRRGQFVTGRLRASEELDVSPGKWLRGMEKLVQAGCISLKSDNQCTIVTVCKYETYQDATGQGGTADSTANGTATSTADGTPSGTANGTADSTRTKNDKNSEEVIKKNSEPEPSQTPAPKTDEEILAQAVNLVADWKFPTGCEAPRFRGALSRWVAARYRQHGWFSEINWDNARLKYFHWTPDQWFEAITSAAVGGNKWLAEYAAQDAGKKSAAPPKSKTKELTAP